MTVVDTQDPDEQTANFLRNSFELGDLANLRMTPLTGGVASDIWKVDHLNNSFVIKRALSKLRVAQDWTAPVSRNASEVAWMKKVASIDSSAVPRILAHDPSVGMFAMEYLDPRSNFVWKDQLLIGNIDPAFAAQVGTALAEIHSATANDEELADTFSNDEMFESIRIDPYFYTTAGRYPDLKDHLINLGKNTLRQKLALVHGDVSPKNILVGSNGPIFLDAECAWYGDPAFDLAFCLNHLLLKCIRVPNHIDKLLESFDSLVSAYFQGVKWENTSRLESRVLLQLPALMLARIDGKSPVEYIESEENKNIVRKFARSKIFEPPKELKQLKNAWCSVCKK